ncbi:DUF2382 domain-containing protein [Williamsia maris]|uniref:DUF2382 domain-containing protein n=1 Tax=Williamsia maris TaxID=72806 RepID=A0ABT1HJC9_9NOCA|nr:DUF2382 domain-containing protein [Williamsia maris]MCP2178031.1 protein of unknown function (DUF2382) [Williamsia maris]
MPCPPKAFAVDRASTDAWLSHTNSPIRGHGPLSDPDPAPAPSAPPTVVDEVSLIASREELAATTERVAVATARLEKFLVTEQRTITVDVVREEVRLVYGRPPDTTVERVRAPSTTDHPVAGSTSDTVVLFAEGIEVTRRWVPIETVRLAVTTVTGTETVTGTVRAELIDTSVAPIGNPDGEPGAGRQS